MALFYHSAGCDYWEVQCVECGEEMHSIYDPAIRDTCAPCGGVSKSPSTDEVRATIRRDYLAKIREMRRA